MHDRFRASGRGLMPGPRLTRVVYLVAGLLFILVFATACGGSSNGPGVVSIDPTTGSTTASTAATPTSAGSQGDPLAYAQCMRAHGIADFPDPNANGGFGIQAGPGSDLDKNNPTFQSASNACESLRPVPSAAQQQQAHDQLLKFSQCMRQNGIADFPDPGADGGLTISSGQGSDLDPNSAAFQAAQQACQSLMPAGKGRPGAQHSDSGGQQP